MLRYPTSTKTAKQLVTQCSNIRKNNLLSQLEIDEVKRASSAEQRCYGKGEPGQQVNAGVSSTPPKNEIGYQAPRTTATLNTTNATVILRMLGYSRGILHGREGWKTRSRQQGERLAS